MNLDDKVDWLRRTPWDHRNRDRLSATFLTGVAVGVLVGLLLASLVTREPAPRGESAEQSR